MLDKRMTELVRQIGLEELADMGQENLEDFAPAAVCGLSDGDIKAIHVPYSGIKAELYGKYEYTTGKVARLMLKAALENGMKPGVVYDFQTDAAGYFYAQHSPFSTQNVEGSVRIFPEMLEIDGNPLALSKVPGAVIDFGACLTGRSLIADQMKFLDSHTRPFMYVPITQLHFTNRVLLNKYNADFGAGVMQAVVEKKMYIGREDGVAAATDELIAQANAHGDPADIADIILATGAQHSTRADMRRGMENAHAILREGGMLIIRALAKPAGDEMGADEMAGWAFENGFEEKHALRYQAFLGRLRTMLTTGHYGNREIKTIILSK